MNHVGGVRLQKDRKTPTRWLSVAINAKNHLLWHKKLNCTSTEKEAESTPQLHEVIGEVEFTISSTDLSNVTF